MLYFWITRPVPAAHSQYFNKNDQKRISMDIFMKLPIIIVLGFIVFSLGEGMYFLAKDDGQADKTRVVKALTVRITLSLILFALLILGYFFGVLEPHGM
jgi:hypothetical protein